MQCKVCGAKLHENSKFCHVCGAKLSKVEIEQLSSPIVQETEVEVEETVEIKETEVESKPSGFSSFRNKLHKVLVNTSDVKEPDSEEIGELKIDEDIISEETVEDTIETEVVEEAGDHIPKISFMDKVKNFINISEPEDDLDEAPLDVEAPEVESIEVELNEVDVVDSEPSESSWSKFKSAFKTFINEDDEDEFNIFESSEPSDVPEKIPNFTPFIDISDEFVSETIGVEDDDTLQARVFEEPIGEILSEEVVKEIVEEVSPEENKKSKPSLRDKLSNFFKEDDTPVEDLIKGDKSDIELVTDSVSKEFLRKPPVAEDTNVYNRSDLEVEDTSSNILESIKSIFSGIANFFVTIFHNLLDFFKPKDKIEQSEAEHMEKSEDTIQITLTDSEKAQLNAGLDDVEEESIFDRMNAILYPYIKQLLGMKSYIRIPLLVFSIFFVAFPIVVTFKQSIAVVIFLVIIKFALALVLANLPLTMAFNITKIKLKRSVISFFVLLSLFVGQFVNFIGYLLYPIAETQTGNLLNALSPAFLISALSFVIVLLFLLAISYNHIKKSNPLIFVGWFTVIHVTIVLMSKLFFVLLSTVLSSLFFNIIA